MTRNRKPFSLFFWTLLVVTLSLQPYLIPINLIKNEKFDVQDYLPDPKTHSQIYLDKDVHSWSENRVHTIQISTTLDFQPPMKLILKKKTFVCVFRQSYPRQVQQTLSKLRKGFYYLGMKIGGKGIGNKFVYISGVFTSIIQKKKVRVEVLLKVPANKGMVFAATSFELPNSGTYTATFSIRETGEIVAGITKITLYRYRSSFDITARPQYTKQSNNFVRNGRFQWPALPEGVASKFIYNWEATPWFILGEVNLVLTSQINQTLRSQGIMFSTYPMPVAVNQTICITDDTTMYILQIVYSTSLIKFKRGTVRILWNDKVVGRIHRRLRAGSATTTNIIIMLPDVMLGINELKFIGSDFLTPNAGIILNEVKIIRGETKKYKLPRGRPGKGSCHNSLTFANEQTSFRGRANTHDPDWDRPGRWSPARERGRFASYSGGKSLSE